MVSVAGQGRTRFDEDIAVVCKFTGFLRRKFASLMAQNAEAAPIGRCWSRRVDARLARDNAAFANMNSAIQSLRENRGGGVCAIAGTIIGRTGDPCSYRRQGSGLQRSPSVLPAA